MGIALKLLAGAVIRRYGTMALRISFKPGMRQSQQAARYFHATVGTLVGGLVEQLHERSYLIAAEKGPSLQLRAWTGEALDDESLHELLDWLLNLRADIHALHEAPGTPDQMAQVVSNWLAARLNGADLFVELTIVEPDGRVQEQAEFSLCMMRGRTVMLSTNMLLFTWLDQDIFGLSLAGHGSYLLELQEEAHGYRKAS